MQNKILVMKLLFNRWPPICPMCFLPLSLMSTRSPWRYDPS